MQMKKIFAICALLIALIAAGCGLFAGDNNAVPAGNATVQSTQSTQSTGGKADNYKANSNKIRIDEDAAYTDKVHVAAYINQFSKLPHNYITKGEARKLGWKQQGTLDEVAPGKSIGGDRYGNREGLLPEAKGRSWRECDIDYVRGNRNGKRIVYSSDGLIYYTGNHYKSFDRLY